MVTLSGLAYGNFNDLGSMLGVPGGVKEVVRKYEADEVKSVYPLEVRIDENALGQIVENHAIRKAVLARNNVLLDTVTTPPCPYGKITRNQRNINSFDEQIENFRSRIHTRFGKTNKDYISIYHLQVSDLKQLD